MASINDIVGRRYDKKSWHRAWMQYFDAQSFCVIVDFHLFLLQLSGKCIITDPRGNAEFPLVVQKSHKQTCISLREKESQNGFLGE